MKNVNTVDTTAAIVTFPASLLETGTALAKATMKAQLKFALLWADAVLQDCDGVELIKACFVAAGFTARDARSVTTNASKFVAPALMYREGKMTEKAFFAMKTQEASDAFKRAGGMKGDGLSPEAWSEARRANNEEAEKPKTGEARPPSGEEKTPALSAFQILSAAISLRLGELSDKEKNMLIEQLLA
jgi:hypothetical protein